MRRPGIGTTTRPHPASQSRCGATALCVILAPFFIALQVAGADASVATGLYVGDGSGARTITGVGFQPSVIIVKGSHAEGAVIRTATMPPGQAKSLAEYRGLLADRILSLTAGGFVVGPAPEVNQAGIEYRWIALAAAGGGVHVGAYVGDGDPARNVGGLPFAPDLVLLIPGDEARCRFRTGAMPAGLSAPLDGVAATGLLTDLTADGFTVGDDAQVNEPGTEYHYLAVAEVAGRARFGAYTGDGSITRVLNVAGFRPQWVLIKAASAPPGAQQTGEKQGSGVTLGLRPEADFAQGILHYTGQGFAVGSNTRVNANGTTYYWAALAGGDDLADLQVSLAADAEIRELGETVAVTASLRNEGPADVTGGALQVDLPPGMVLQGFVADPDTVADRSTAAQIHLVYDLTAGQQRGVTADFLVATGPPVRTFTASVAATSQPDPDPTNDTDSVTVTVPSADLALALATSADEPQEGDEFELLITLSNHGPQAPLDPLVAIALPAALEVLAADPSAGTYDPDAAEWRPGTLADGEQAVLTLTALVTAGHGGQTVTVSGTVADARNDPEPANNTAAVTLHLAEAATVSVTVVPFALEHRTLLPGGPPDDVLHLRLVNHGAEPRTLTSIAIANQLTGDGDQAAQDGYWQDVALRTAGGATLAIGQFAAGRFDVAGIDLELAGGATLDLLLSGTAALTAPDGVELQPVVATDEDVQFQTPVDLAGDWPLSAPGTLLVDGMTAAQIVVHPVGAEVFQLGSERNLALDVVIPGNGGQPDVLTKLNVVNLGDAPSGTVLTRVEAWADDGDGIFDPVADQRIGQLFWTGGDRYEASALGIAIPAEGLRVFVSVDVAGDALGGTVRLSLPAGDDVAINVLSGNDGPIDEPVVNPYTQTISATDRVVLTAAAIAPRTVAPGEERVPLLHLIARNLHDEPQTLTRLRVRNVTRSAAGTSQADLDGTVGQLVLQRDGNGNGEVDDPQLDPVLGTTVWQDGAAVFEGLQWTLAAGATGHLFLGGHVSLHGAADGDSLGAVIAASHDLQFAADAATVGAWPLDSGGRHRVRGMVAAQVACPAVPAISLAAGEGPVLAMELVVPSNGHRDDILQHVRLTNLGSATPDDIASLELWAAVGGGGFDPASDDHLGPLTSSGQDWLALDLDLDVFRPGRRLFVSLTVAETPADSATVRLAVPVNGLTMASTNDGPRDLPVAGATTLLISTAPLLSSLSFDHPRSTTEMTVPATMRVVNAGGERIEDIVPEALTVSGDGQVEIIAGPQPASLALEPGEVGLFTWQLAGGTAGTVQIAARCSGVGAVGGQPRQSLASTSAPHAILLPAVDLGLYPQTAMPFSINRGQTGLVPLILTLVNDGGEQRAEIRLERLIVTLDDGEGQPVLPADLLARATVNEGLVIYCDRQQFAPDESALTLDLEPPVVVTAREPTTIGLRLDIAPDTPVSRFRVGLLADSDLAIADDLSGEARGLQLLEGTFPIRSGTGTIVALAAGIEVAAVTLDPVTAGPGQLERELLRLHLDGLGDDANSEVKIGAFAVAITDTGGSVALVDPSQQLTRLWVQGPITTHALHQLAGPADSLIVFQCSPPITVPVAAPPVAISVLGRVADDPVLGGLRLRLAGPELVDARDGNHSGPVPVSYREAPILGPHLTVQAPAPPLQASVEPRLTAVLPYGARDVTALVLRLAHPGGDQTAAVRLDTLRLTSLDELRQLQDPRHAIEAARLTWNDEPVTGPLHFGSAGLTMPLGGRLLQPGEQAALVWRLDLVAAGPATGVELVFAAADLAAVDHNLAAPVGVLPAAGAVLPGSSGLSRLQAASGEILATWEDRLPPLLPAGDEQVSAARLGLVNPAPAGAAPLELVSVALRAADRDGSPLPVGAALSAASLWLDDEPWASVTTIAPQDTVVIMAAAVPVELMAGLTSVLELRVAGRAAVAGGGLRLGLDDGDIVCRQPGGGASVPVRAASGQTLPFWTAAAGLITADLGASFINFPNPFAAGRDATAFAFNLPRPALVSLQLWSPRGEPVRTLLKDATLAAGLHQDLVWEGRNGRGHAVVNGVYLAELTVRFTDGGRERLLRKVAVVR